MTNDEAVISEVVKNIRHRAKELRGDANFVFWQTFGALILGLALFILAGPITSLDSIELKKTLVEEAEKAAATPSPNPAVNGAPVTRQDLAATVAELKKTLGSEQEGTTQAISAISANLTRVGAVLILFFLVQILVSLQRYKLRLAYYFEGRADALTLFKSREERDFQRLVTALSPEILDFGKPPKSPTEHAIMLAEKLAHIGRKKDSE